MWDLNWNPPSEGAATSTPCRLLSLAETTWLSPELESRMKPILVVTFAEPTEGNFGGLMRSRLMIEALADLAPVELAVINGRTGLGPDVYAESVHRARRFTISSTLTLADRLKWIMNPKIPLSLAANDYRSLRRDFKQWMSEYSLIWIIRTSVYHAVEPVLPTGVPVVVDVDDLESVKLEGYLASRRRGSDSDGLLKYLARIPSEMQGKLNIQAWRKFDAKVTREVDAAIVCSPEDARSIGGNAIVIPNSYPTPPKPLGQIFRDESPVILLQGQLTYAPNADGAEFFVTHVLPYIRNADPNISVRLVGRSDERVQRLANVPNVKVLGFVPDIGDELRLADLIVVPIRFGGGTRIKILEAFAHGIPVVSTSIGAHGLGAVAGIHILEADDPEDFARACIRALTDLDLRASLASSGRDLFERNFRDEVVKEAIQETARRLLV